MFTISVSVLLSNTDALEVAVRFHGTYESAVEWLKTPNLTFVGVAPLEFTRTEA